MEARAVAEGPAAAEGPEGPAADANGAADAHDASTVVIRRLVNAACGGPDDVATAFRDCFPNRFAYLGETVGWAEWNGKWRLTGPEPAKLLGHILREFRETLAALGDSFDTAALGLVEDATRSGPTALARQAGARQAAGLLRSLAENLTEPQFRHSVLPPLSRKYAVDEPERWVARLDANKHLLGLVDGVYDFRTNSVRPKDPDDMLSFYCVQHAATAKDLDALGMFMAAFFDPSEDYSDKVALADVLAQIKESELFKHGAPPVTTAAALGKKLRAKEFQISKTKGLAFVRHLRQGRLV